MLAKRKKGVMGIGTLIIFISVILVAAVAAGVIISTAGLLQQKSLIVGEEARKRLVNQLEVISVLAAGNISGETVNNFEVLTRLGPGSNPIQLRTLGISFLTNSFDTAMTLQHETMDNDTYDVFGVSTVKSLVGGGSFITIDDRDRDGTLDKIYLFNNTPTTDKFYVELSNDNDPVNATASVGINFSSGTSRFVDDGYLIMYNEMGYGFVRLKGNINSSNISMDYVNFTIKDHINGCEAEQIPPEDKFCYITKLGDGDTVLDAGEVVEFRFRTSLTNAPGVNELFEITMFPDKGSLTRISRRTPDVITTTKAFLFP